MPPSSSIGHAVRASPESTAIMLGRFRSDIKWIRLDLATYWPEVELTQSNMKSVEKFSPVACMNCMLAPADAPEYDRKTGDATGVSKMKLV